MQDGKLTALDRERIALCDLLQGRGLRRRAEEEFLDALELECLGLPGESVTPWLTISERVARAAHMEWVAGLTEQGRVGWGGRINRCDDVFHFEISLEPMEAVAWSE